MPFESVGIDQKPFRFICPDCGGRVKFGKAEFVLGKTYRTPGCPKSKLTERAIFFIQLVKWSEATGKLPTSDTLLGESNLYFEIRSIILSEENMSEEEMAPKEDNKGGRQKP